MKKIIYSLMLCLSFVMLFSACEEDPMYTDSRVTYYATLELKGDATMYWEKGTPFVDPGFVSEMKGEDVSSQVKVEGNVDSNKGGIYNLIYSISNSDGYSVSASRTVYVYDSTPSTLGTGVFTMNTDAASYREYYSINDDDGSIETTKTEYGKPFKIMLIQLEPNVYYISDFFGGFYDQLREYESNYAMTGTFKLNADNTITLVDSYIIGWGDSLGDLSGTYDPASKTFSFVSAYNTLSNGDPMMKFFVTMTK